MSASLGGRLELVKKELRLSALLKVTFDLQTFRNAWGITR
jgi:hypothetical protein